MSGSGREVLPDVQVCSRGSPRSPGVVGTPSQMYGSGWETLPDIRVVEWPSRMSGSCREALTDVREWSGGPPGCSGGLADVQEWWEALSDVWKALRMPGVVGSPSQMSGSFWKALMDTRLPGRPSWMSESGREALMDVQEWLGVPPGCSRVVGSPSRMSGSHSRMFGSGRESLPDIWEALQMSASGGRPSRMSGRP